MSKDLEQIIKNLARAVDYRCTQDEAHTYPTSRCKVAGECGELASEVKKVLTHKVLPLLEAGQAMLDWETEYRMKNFPGRTPPHPFTLWSAAKREAMKL